MGWLVLRDMRKRRWLAVAALFASAALEAPLGLMAVFLGDDPNAPQAVVEAAFRWLFYYPVGAVLGAALAAGLFRLRRPRAGWAVLALAGAWGASILIAFVAVLLMATVIGPLQRRLAWGG